MLTNEVKHKVFLKLRAENYRASLRLEGMVPRPAASDQPAVPALAATLTLKTKHGR